MKKTVALLLLMLASQVSYAKCAGDFYAFTGSVVDSTGKPLPGATVGISWNEYEGITGPAVATTDTHGRYRILIYFDNYSGKGAVHEDDCNQRLRWISVTAYKGHLRSPFLRHKVVGTETVRVPTIKVWVETEKDPPKLKFHERAANE